MHITIITLLLLSFFLASGCATVTVEEHQEAEYHYKMGISHLNEGNIQMAFVQLQKSLQLDPDNKETLHSLGLVYLQLEEYDNARELFLKAIAADRHFSDAHNSLGFTYMKLGKWQEAVASFKQALANPLYQTPEKAFYNLGIAYYRQEQFDAALDAFKSALKRTPSFTPPFYGLALVYNKLGRYGDAAAAMDRAIDADPVYKGDKKRFQSDVRERLVAAKGFDEKDLRDYLEISKY
ncbi:MAG: tetratricopeptide repeat protein [Nitrospirota bacterium]